MKSFTLASAALIAAAVAKPINPRDLVVVTDVKWVTEVVTVTEIIDSTTTLYVSDGEPIPTYADSTYTLPEPSDAQFFEPPSPIPEKPKETSIASPPAPPPSTPTPPSPAPPPATTQAPPPAITQAPPPAITQAPPSAITQAPPSAITQAPAPAAPAASQLAPEKKPETKPETTSTQSSGSAGSAGSGQNKGDLTYYAVGLGACGDDDSGMDNSENIVALASSFMGPQSNGNKYCGKTVTIYGNGKSVTATVRDKCPGCDTHDLDVSEKVYKELFGSLDSGRQTISWSIN